MLIGRDVSNEKQLKRDLAIEDAQNRMLVTIIKGLFFNFCEESEKGFKRAYALMEQVEEVGRVNELFRLAHSFKGNANGFDMAVLAQ